MEEEIRSAGRWELLRDVLVFQGKLLVDGLRDVLLSPVSLVAAILDVFEAGDRPGQHFYNTVMFGRRTERWINLFGAADHLDEESDDNKETQGLDALVKQLEGVVMKEYERGGITTKTKNAVDYTLDNLLLKTRKQENDDQ